MKSIKKWSLLHYLSIVVFLLSQFYCSTGGFDYNEKSDFESMNRDGERILSRKRRYLIFPAGSSFQMGKKCKIESDKSNLNKSSHL
jgi:hypothetical protein